MFRSAGEAMTARTMVEVARLIDPQMGVQIEADAVVTLAQA